MSLISWHSSVGIPINFHEESGIFTFEALNSVHLSKGQRYVRPPVQKRRRPQAFSRVCTRNSDKPSSSEMEDKPAFNPL